MLLSPISRSTGLEMVMNPGDLINLSENLVNINNAIAYQYTGADIAKANIFRTGIGGAGTDTLPTAAQILDAINGSINDVSPPSNELYGIQPNRSVVLAWPANVAPLMPGSTFRVMIVQTTAFAVTMAVPASSGMSFDAAPFNQTNIAASSWREYLFQIKNSSPLASISCNGVNGQSTITVPSGYLDLINNITMGMSVYGTSIGANAVVTAVNRDTGVITLSTANTGTITLGAINFTPTIVVSGLRSGTL